MEYREFLENVRKEVESRYDSNVSVTLNHVMKNNGTELDGITIMEKDKNIAPTIYINSFYDTQSRQEPEKSKNQQVEKTPDIEQPIPKKKQQEEDLELLKKPKRSRGFGMGM